MSSSGKYRLGQLKGFSLFYFTWTFVAVFLVKMIEHLVPIIWAVLLKIALLTEILEGVRKCALKMIVFLYNLTNMPRLVRPCKSSWFWLPLATYTFFQQFFLNKLNKQTNIITKIMKIKPKLTHAILIVKLKLKISCLVAIKFEKFTNPLELKVVAKTFKIKYDFSRIYIEGTRTKNF